MSVYKNLRLAGKVAQLPKEVLGSAMNTGSIVSDARQMVSGARDIKHAIEDKDASTASRVLNGAAGAAKVTSGALSAASRGQKDEAAQSKLQGASAVLEVTAKAAQFGAKRVDRPPPSRDASENTSGLRSLRGRYTAGVDGSLIKAGSNMRDSMSSSLSKPTLSAKDLAGIKGKTEAARPSRYDDRNDRARGGSIGR
jgi:hypothetical protein